MPGRASSGAPRPRRRSRPKPQPRSRRRPAASAVEAEKKDEDPVRVPLLPYSSDAASLSALPSSSSSPDLSSLPPFLPYSLSASSLSSCFPLFVPPHAISPHPRPISSTRSRMRGRKVGVEIEINIEAARTRDCGTSKIPRLSSSRRSARLGGCQCQRGVAKAVAQEVAEHHANGPRLDEPWRKERSMMNKGEDPTDDERG
eukprot:6088664-Pyramimonas_sp.AAC.1